MDGRPEDVPPGRLVSHEIEIAAPAPLVWALVSTPDRWPEWNPVYPQATGGSDVGDRILMTTHLPGARPMRFKATVFMHVPGRHLRFGASVFLGLLKATRFIDVTALAPDRCRVINGEALSRPLGRLLFARSSRSMALALRQANEGLKRVAEDEASRVQ